MGKRKKANPTTEPRKNPDLATHCHPTTTSTPERKRRPPPRDPAPSTAAGSDSSPDSSPGSVRRLIEPYSKPRLVSILVESAAADPALRARLAAAADASPSHHRLFVHGLPPRADSAALADAFSRFGPLSDFHAVAADRAAGGRCRGYGFVTFASRAASRRALRDAPRVTVAGFHVSAQFASAGPDPPSGGGGGAGRRVYVTNVAPDAGGAERLRAFFEGFGALEGGPFGFDGDTRRSRGYALFVYRAAAGAAKAVAEPYRAFEGRTLRCQLADEPKRKAKALPAAPAPAVVAASAAVTSPTPPAAAEAPALQPVLDAIAAAGVGDLAMYARDPAQAAALLGKNPALAAAALSSALASAAAASRSPAVAAVAPSQAAVAAVEKSPVKFGVRPSGSAGLLGPYKPSSSPVVSSSHGGREQC